MPVCTLLQIGSSLSGSCVGPQAKGNVTGTVTGPTAEWRWEWVTHAGGASGSFTFTGAVHSDNSISGIMERGTFTARRQQSQDTYRAAAGAHATTTEQPKSYQTPLYVQQALAEAEAERPAREAALKKYREEQQRFQQQQRAGRQQAKDVFPCRAMPAPGPGSWSTSAGCTWTKLRPDAPTQPVQRQAAPQMQKYQILRSGTADTEMPSIDPNTAARAAGGYTSMNGWQTVVIPESTGKRGNPQYRWERIPTTVQNDLHNPFAQFDPQDVATARAMFPFQGREMWQWLKDQKNIQLDRQQGNSYSIGIRR